MSIKSQLAAVIERRTGLTVDQIRAMSADDRQDAVERKIGKPLTYEFEPSLHPRGNVYLQTGRILWPDEDLKDVEAPTR